MLETKRLVLTILLASALLRSVTADPTPSSPYSPTALAFDAATRTVVVAEKTGSSIDILDLPGQLLARYPVVGQPSGVCSYKGNILLTTSVGADAFLLHLNLATGEVIGKCAVGQGARAPLLDPVREVAYVCNYFTNDVSVIDLREFEETRRISVLRMPAGIVATPDGGLLFVTNFLPETRADLPVVAAKVTVIDAVSYEIVRHIQLENGSNGLRDIAITPDGSSVLVTHNLGRFQVPTTHLDRGWMATSALSIIDVASQALRATVLLDEVDRGAAGSWGVDISDDGEYIFVAHSSTHDFSIIDWEGLQKKIAQRANLATLSYDLSFLDGLRRRIQLQGNGPREIVAAEGRLFLGEYFSDSISIAEIDSMKSVRVARRELNPNLSMTEERRGEMIFNDASHCYQMWQSCNSCHPDDVRGDGLNWDLLNDGLGNPKNVKNLIFSHVTPPTTITGCRANAEVSVRAGFKYIQFAEVPDEMAQAVDAYLKSLRPEPSPFLFNGALSESALEGKKLFHGRARCSKCHNGEYFTDMEMHDMENAGPRDKTSIWDTPTLREVWRTGPYLHDGRASTLYDVLVQENHNRAADKFSERELEQLVDYVRTL